jgi:hypothetical protein
VGEHLASQAAGGIVAPDDPDQLHVPAERPDVVRTLPAPPMRYSSWSCSTTGTGASGEMRLTRPMTKWSSIRSPATSTDIV